MDQSPAAARNDIGHVAHTRFKVFAYDALTLRHLGYVDLKENHYGSVEPQSTPDACRHMQKVLERTGWLPHETMLWNGIWHITHEIGVACFHHESFPEARVGDRLEAPSLMQVLSDAMRKIHETVCDVCTLSAIAGEENCGDVLVSKTLSFERVLYDPFNNQIWVG